MRIKSMGTNESKNNLNNERLVIGKIPGYNTKIQKPKGIKYQDRLLNNLTSVSLKPTGYNINWGTLTDNQKLYNHGDKAQSSAASILDNWGVSTLTAIQSWKALIASQAECDAFKSFLATDTKALNIKELFILCTNDSTMSEVFSNSFEMSTAEMMANEFAQNGAIKSLANAKKALTVDSNLGIAMLGGVDIIANKFSDGLNSILPKDWNLNPALINLAAGKALGIQTSLPEEWRSSDYNNTLQLMIKLVSPAGDEDSIKNYILKPLLFLILATAPVTTNGLGFGYPMIWEVKADGLMDMELAGISALTITRGGAETQFNQHNQPLNIDVRLTISPLTKGFASALSTSKDNSGADIYAKMIGSSPKLLSDSFSRSKSNGNYHKTIQL